VDGNRSTAARRPLLGSARAGWFLGVACAAVGVAWIAWGLRRHEAESRALDARAVAESPSRSASSATPDAPTPAGRTSATSTAETPSPDPVHAKVPDPEVAGCLALEDLDAFRKCVAARLDAKPDARAIARLLCRRSKSHDANRILLAEALLRVTPARVLEWIGPAESECPRLLGWGDLEGAFADCGARDPAWLQAFRQNLSPESLFDPRSGEAGILVAVSFLKKGDLEMRTWIEQGARGEFGGTSAQIDRAIGAALVIQATGDERLAFLRSVLASPSVPGEAGVGATLVHQLVDTKSWPDGQSSAALDTMMQVLYEPRYEDSAAATICLQFTNEAPPGCDPNLWSAIRARAIEIAHGIGLVMPEGK
jgi:hypothetical protein